MYVGLRQAVGSGIVLVRVMRSTPQALPPRYAIFSISSRIGGVRNCNGLITLTNKSSQIGYRLRSLLSVKLFITVNHCTTYMLKLGCKMFWHDVH